MGKNGIAEVGKYYFSGNSGSFERIAIDSAVEHPDYVAGPEFNDIAVLKLKEKSENTYAMLNSYETVPEDDDELHVIGLGTTDPSIVVFPDVLQEVSVHYLENDECSEKVGSMTDDMMCAWEQGQDAWYVFCYCFVIDFLPLVIVHLCCLADINPHIRSYFLCIIVQQRRLWWSALAEGRQRRG